MISSQGTGQRIPRAGSTIVIEIAKLLRAGKAHLEAS
jgi:hypothetical protein